MTMAYLHYMQYHVERMKPDTKAYLLESSRLAFLCSSLKLYLYLYLYHLYLYCSNTRNIIRWDFFQQIQARTLITSSPSEPWLTSMEDALRCPPRAFSPATSAVLPPFLPSSLSLCLPPHFAFPPLCFPRGTEWLMGWWQSCLFMLLSRLRSGPLPTLVPGYSRRRFIFLHSLSSLA